MMNDDVNAPGFTPAPFPPIGEPTQHSATGQPPKKQGGRRGPRQAKSATKPKNGRRKKRMPNAKALSEVTRKHLGLATPQTGMKVDLATALSALSPLSPPEQQVLSACWVNLAALDKKSRDRVLNALVKVIA